MKTTQRLIRSSLQVVVLLGVFGVDGAWGQQQSITLPITLKNGCTVEMLTSINMKSMTVSKQDYYPSTCPASGRYTGSVALGVGWTLVYPDGTSREFSAIRIGQVLDGRFDGVRMSISQQGDLIFAWQDQSGQGNVKQFMRNSVNYQFETVKSALAQAIAAAPSANPKVNQSYLETQLIYWDQNPAKVLQRFTSDPHSKPFMNPNWEGLSSKSNGASTAGQLDDPKVFGRSARGG